MQQIIVSPQQRFAARIAAAVVGLLVFKWFFFDSRVSRHLPRLSRSGRLSSLANTNSSESTARECRRRDRTPGHL